MMVGADHPLRSTVPAEDPGSVAPVELAEPPEVAHALFGAQLPLVLRYAQLLASDGVLRGLIGPREAPRLWERHLLNCAVVAELIPDGALVGDVGSGAGLPGIPLALARPDLRIELIEPMDRRAAFLRDVVAALGLDSVVVLRSRGEEATRDRYDVVTARAVAPLERLVPMALPLARLGGLLLAMKGATALAELSAAAATTEAAGGSRAELRTVGVGIVDPPTSIVRICRLRAVPGARRRDGQHA